MAVVEPPPLDFDDEVQTDDEESKYEIVSSVTWTDKPELNNIVEADLETAKDSAVSKEVDISADSYLSPVSALSHNLGNFLDINLKAEEKNEEIKSNCPPKLRTEHLNAISFQLPVGFKQVDHPSLFSPLDVQIESQSEDRNGGDLIISVSDPRKVGENVSAYIVYKVSTKTTMPAFHKREIEVYRRFSDFLGLHEKLHEKHAREGRFIPLPPEKSIIYMARVKVAKEASNSSDFLERRRMLLGRFLRRIAEHPHLRSDPIFVDFLETEGELARSTNTSALSGAGVMRLFHRVGESFNKVTYKMEDPDEWFETKMVHLSCTENNLESVHSCLEDVIHHKKELYQNSGLMSKSLSYLAPIEEVAGLSRVLLHLSEVCENLEVSHQEHNGDGCGALLEFIKECLGIIHSAKEAMSEREKLHKLWKETEVTLAKKREAKVRMELAHRTDKLVEASREITEWEQNTEKNQDDFEKISWNIKEEMVRLNSVMVKDFKEVLLSFLESSLIYQKKVIKCWESFLPEVQNIT